MLPVKDGLFLVRESTQFPGDYTLCVAYVLATLANTRIIYYILNVDLIKKLNITELLIRTVK